MTFSRYLDIIIIFGCDDNKIKTVFTIMCAQCSKSENVRVLDVLAPGQFIHLHSTRIDDMDSFL